MDKRLGQFMTPPDIARLVVKKNGLIHGVVFNKKKTCSDSMWLRTQRR